MNLDSVRELSVDAPLRDVLQDLHQRGFKRYVSPWVSLDTNASYGFPHGLVDIPHVVSVLSATDSQGTAKAQASAVTVDSTVTIVTVTNTGAARYFQVRAF